MKPKPITEMLSQLMSVYYSSLTHLDDRVHEAVCSRHVDQSTVVSVISHASLSLCC